jgi:hypothetical protein
MGTWGTGLFSDDEACDIRDEYGVLIAKGMSPAQASRKLEEDRSELLESGLVPHFWLALAATQMKLGSLEDDVKNKALAEIEAGHDLERWSQSKDKAQRKRMLKALKEKITTFQPTGKTGKLPFVEQTTSKRGDAFSYGMKDGRRVVFRVVGVYSDAGGSFPWVELCDWIGHDVPQPTAIEALPFRHCWYLNNRSSQFLLMAGNARGYPAARITLIGEGLTITRQPFHPSTEKMLSWKELDTFLVNSFSDR